MNAQVTFKDVEQKYRYAAEHMIHCRTLALNDKVPANASWVHLPTLAWWLEEGIGEFAEEYGRTAEKCIQRAFEKPGVISAEKWVQAVVWRTDINERRLNARFEIMMKYPEAFREPRAEALV